MSKYVLRLYITGHTSRSLRAIKALEQICAEEMNQGYELDVVDIRENPHLAEEDQVLATPTLIKRLPLPIRRIIGDLNDREKVLIALDLKTGSGDG